MVVDRGVVFEGVGGQGWVGGSPVGLEVFIEMVTSLLQLWLVQDHIKHVLVKWFSQHFSWWCRCVSLLALLDGVVV